MYERVFRMLQPKYDPNGRVRIELSSNDTELGKYLQFRRARGCTHMNEDGKIFVWMDDAGNATIGTWFEEFGHALQYLKYGNVTLSVDSKEQLEREYEVAVCLLERHEQLRLSEIDIKESLKSVEEYEEYKGGRESD